MSNDGVIERMWARVHNITRRVSINVVDDTGVYQSAQTTGYVGEVRDNIPRVHEFGFASNPLPGAEGITVATNAGYLSTSAITNTNDPRYRVKNQKPGETAVYMVDGAGSDGTNGTCRTILKGALQWITTMYGKTINVGDSNAVTINVGTTANSVTINMGGSNATVNITGSSGDVKVNQVSLVNHVHSNSGGSGNGGPPVKS